MSNMVFLRKSNLRLPITSLFRANSTKVTKVLTSKNYVNLSKLARRGGLFGSSLIIMLLSSTTTSNCAEKDDGDKPSDNKDKVDPVEKIIKLIYPHVSTWGIGGVFGFCSGIALKRLGAYIYILYGIDK